MKADLIEKAYAVAKDRYAAIGVNTDKVLDQLQKQQISLHCWQTDDVVGFERNDALSGGIQTTGNYPGRARNIDEVRQDIEFVKTLLAGNHRLNLHEIYSSVLSGSTPNSISFSEAFLTASLLAIGNIPGSPKSTVATLMLCASVNSLGAGEKFLLLVSNSQ